MRTSRLVAVAVVLAGAAAVTSASAPPGPGTAAPDPPAVADLIRIPLRYGPAWLPDGFVERGRVLSSLEPDHARLVGRASLHRTWQTGSVAPVDGGPYVSVSLRAASSSHDFDCPDARPVDVGGVSGRHRRWDTKACVDWPVDGATRVLVVVGGAGVDPDDALRVARSVRPVDGTFVVPFRLLRRDFVYGDSRSTYIRVTGTSPTDWTATTMMGPDAKNDPRQLIVTVGTTTDAPPGGSPHPVGGRTGRHVLVSGNIDSSFLVLDLGPRLLLTVRYWRTQGGLPPVTELEKVVHRLRVGTPDMSWIGAR